MKKIFSFCFALVMVAGLAQAAAVNQVAAVVNGKMISLYDVQLSAGPALAKAGLSTKNPGNSAQVQEIYRKTLDNLIIELLIVAAAEKQGLTASSTEIDAEIARIMQQSRTNKAQFEKQLRAEGMTITAYQHRIANSILRNKLMGAMVGRKIIVTPDEVRAYYEANKSKYVSKPETILALLVYPNSIDPAGYAAQLIKDPSKFETVVQQVSEGPNKAGGGVIGAVDFTKMPPQLVTLINKLPVGGVTPMLVLNGKKSQFKKVKASKGGEQLTFLEAQPMADREVREPRLKERFDEYVHQLRSNAVVDIRI